MAVSITEVTGIYSYWELQSVKRFIISILFSHDRDWSPQKFLVTLYVYSSHRVHSHLVTSLNLTQSVGHKLMVEIMKSRGTGTRNEWGKVRNKRYGHFTFLIIKSTNFQLNFVIYPLSIFYKSSQNRILLSHIL